MEICVGGEGLPRGFVELGAQVYGDDPLWIPEEPAVLQAAFGAGNPWFARAEAKSFCLPGRARLAVFLEPGAKVRGKSAAFFGYWEAVSDVAPSQQLFAEAMAWAQDRGAACLCGPINFSTFGQYRLRTAAVAGAVPFLGEPYNPPYYPGLLVELGFEVVERYRSRGFSRRYYDALLAVRRKTLDFVLSQGYRFERLDPRWWLDHLPQLHRDVDAIFGDNVGYTPLSWPEFERACGEAMVGKVCTRTSSLIFGPDGDLAGIVLLYPHYGPLAIQAAGAARVRQSALRFGEHVHLLDGSRVRVMVLKTLGVRPEHRGKGLSHAMTSGPLIGSLDHYNYLISALQRSGSLLDRSAAALKVAMDECSEASHEDFSETPLGGDREYALYCKDI